jgi:NAD(P)-dependent dehydrogenase (short-subunit alcohol dehydrogenase family)
MAAFGRLDVLVNMASVYLAVDETDEHGWNAVIDVDLRRVPLRARGLRQRRGGRGRIVNALTAAASGRPRYTGFLPQRRQWRDRAHRSLALEVARQHLVNRGSRAHPRAAQSGRGCTPSRPRRRFAAGAADAIVRADVPVETDFVTGNHPRMADAPQVAEPFQPIGAVGRPLHTHSRRLSKISNLRDPADRQ